MTTTDWNEQELGDILTLNYGWSLPEKKRVPGDVPVYGSNGIVGTHKRALVTSSGLIVGRKGSAGNVHYSRKPFCPIDTTFYIAPGDTSLDMDFLYFLLLHIDLKRILGDVGVPGLNREMAYKEKVRFPTRPDEQCKIASVLGLVQLAIEQQERLVVLTSELKKALLHKLLADGLRSERQKQTEIGPVPLSWEITELGKVVNLFGGYAFKSDEGVNNSNTQLVRMGNLYQNKLALNRSPIYYPDEFAKRYPRFVLQPGDLIMSLTGTSGKEDYGFTVELKPAPKTLLLNQRIARVDLISERLTKEFLLYYLLSRKFLDHLYPTAKGMKQANLSTHAMKRLKVPIPSLDEQKEIADCFKTIDRKIELHQSKLDSLRDLFRTLLYQLMTAQIRVDDFELPELETML